MEALKNELELDKREMKKILDIGDKDVVAFLLTNNLLNPKGHAPLYLACHNKCASLAKFLIEKGAAVNARDIHGWVPLHWACVNGHDQIVRLLIEKGASLNARDNDGLTPLHFACQNGRKSIVKLLIEKGALLDAQDKYGKTPLYRACYNDRGFIARLLIEKGAILSPEMAEAFPLLNPYYEIRNTVQLLILTREYCPNSLLDKDYLPLDLFGLLCKEFAREQKLAPYQKFIQ